MKRKCIWKCCLLHGNAYVKNLFRQTTLIRIRLLLEEQSDLGPHCLLQRSFKKKRGDSHKTTFSHDKQILTFFNGSTHIWWWLDICRVWRYIVGGDGRGWVAWQWRMRIVHVWIWLKIRKNKKHVNINSLSPSVVC